MTTKFKEWWNRPIEKKDRIKAIVIGAIGCCWIVVLGRLFFSSEPVNLIVLILWAIGSIITGIILGLLFPKFVTLVLSPFSVFGIGGGS